MNNYTLELFRYEKQKEKLITEIPASASKFDEYSERWYYALGLNVWRQLTKEQKDAMKEEWKDWKDWKLREITKQEKRSKARGA